jgi:hypothetical protein
MFLDDGVAGERGTERNASAVKNAFGSNQPATVRLRNICLFMWEEAGLLLQQMVERLSAAARCFAR